MRIILTENDIKKALIAYTSTLGLDLANHHVAIELTAGRGANGHSATVIIDEADTEAGVVLVEPAKAVVKGVNGGTSPKVTPQAVYETQSAPEEVEEDLPPVTPETVGQESKTTSLFSD